MKVFLLTSFLLGVTVALPVPHHLGLSLASLGPGTKSTYHGVLGTFPVSPAEVYTPFTPNLGYQVPITYYTPGYPGYLGYQYQFAGVPLLDTTLQLPQLTGVPVYPIGGVIPSHPEVPVVPNPGVPSQTGQVEETNPSDVTTETQTEIAEDSVFDDDTVTIEAS